MREKRQKQTENFRLKRTRISRVLHAYEKTTVAIDTIIKAVTKGDSVQLIGFGTFSSGKRAARMGRNPKTGEPLKIAAAKTVKFSAGKAFKDSVNKRKK